MRTLIAAVLIFASTTLLAAPKPVAPESLPHASALFLSGLSSDGKRSVTFKAMARNTRFFLEEPGGVTVYLFDGNEYRRETFLRGAKLTAAVKKYGK